MRTLNETMNRSLQDAQAIEIFKQCSWSQWVWIWALETSIWMGGLGWILAMQENLNRGERVLGVCGMWVLWMSLTVILKLEWVKKSNGLVKKVNVNDMMNIIHQWPKQKRITRDRLADGGVVLLMIIGLMHHAGWIGTTQGFPQVGYHEPQQWLYATLMVSILLTWWVRNELLRNRWTEPLLKKQYIEVFQWKNESKSIEKYIQDYCINQTRELSQQEYAQMINWMHHEHKIEVQEQKEQEAYKNIYTKPNKQ